MSDSIEITTLGSKGEGIGRLKGKTLFVEGALPGEEVEVEINEEKPRWARGALRRIRKRSRERVAPPCPLFEKCGGCQLMHLSYEGQLAMKRQKVTDALTRIGKLSCQVEPCLPSPDPLHYRNKIQLPVVAGPEGIEMGLYAKGTHEVIPVKQCLIHCEAGEQVYGEVRELVQNSRLVAYDEKSGKGELRHILIRTTAKSRESLVILVSNGPFSRELLGVAKEIEARVAGVRGVYGCVNRRRDNVILGSSYELLAGEATIEEEIADLRFGVSPASFFQVNPQQAERLYVIALEMAELSKESRVLDAYCGVGTLALLAARAAGEVVGVEVVEEAVRDARRNAERNGLTNATFHVSSTEKALDLFKSLDVVFLNPPRKGCHGDVLEALLERRPEKIVYVSCDPATLARDLRVLSDGYKIERVQPVDMFPQTAHVETVVQLRRIT